MVERAAESASLCFGKHQCQGFPRRSDQLSGKLLAARWIIGADGISLSSAPLAGLESFRQNQSRFGFQPLQRSALEQLHRTLLGPQCSGICHARGDERGLCRANFA